MDLASDADVHLVAEGSHGPNFLSAAGDVNGDGYRDVLVSTTLTDFNSRPDAGSAWVVFGPFENGTVDINSAPGFRIEGARDGDHAGIDTAGLGDVNGDGIGDVLVGASRTNNAHGTRSGAAYVVFGKDDNEPVDLLDFDNATQGDAGFRISGASSIGDQLSDTGDMNGDGLNDMILGSGFGGSAYVVFGKEDSDPIDLVDFDNGTQGAAGFRIDHPSPGTNDDVTYGVAGVGDVNGDGTPDVIVDVCRAAYHSAGSFDCRRPKAWVVFGKAGPKPLDVRDLGRKGFLIKGAREAASLAVNPGRSGDINRDGLADFVVLNWWDTMPNSGYVIFGKRGPRTIALGKLGRHGYKLKGWHEERDAFYFGRLYETAPAGDVNRDGVPDVLLSAPEARPRERRGAGVVFVVYGKKRNRDTIKLRHLGDRGYRIDGQGKGANAGIDLDGGGRLNGDARPDVLLSTIFDRDEVILSWGRNL